MLCPQDCFAEQTPTIVHGVGSGCRYGHRTGPFSLWPGDPGPCPSGREWFPVPCLNHGFVQFSVPTASFPGEQETQGPAPLAQVGLLLPRPQEMRGRGGDYQPSRVDLLA